MLSAHRKLLLSRLESIGRGAATQQKPSAHHNALFLGKLFSALAADLAGQQQDHVSALCKQGKLRQVLDLIDQQLVQASVATYGFLLRECSAMKCLSHGKIVHLHIVARTGLLPDSFLENHLVQMYLKCGSLTDASKVFCAMGYRGVIVWTAMIAAYAQGGHYTQAIQHFKAMQLEGVMPDRVTFIAVLNACTSAEDLAEGKLIHRNVAETRLESNVSMANALLSMYSRSGSLEDAREVFDGMQRRDVISWTGMIAAYHREHFSEALQLFRKMQMQGVKPNNITFVTILHACDSPAALAEGTLIHSWVLETEFCSDLVVETALVHMYGKCASSEAAFGIFQSMQHRNVISWNAMVATFALHGESQEALNLFREMQLEGVAPNKISFVTVVNVCASMLAVKDGKLCHACALESGFEQDVVVKTALINMYGKCGLLHEARRLFDSMDARTEMSWNAMISGYVQHGQLLEALGLFQQMDLLPDKNTLIAAMNASAGLAALEEGRLVHSKAVESGLESNLVVGNAIIDMYSKCGSLEDAQRVFDRIPQRDVFSWNTLIASYAQNGHGEMSLEVFAQMEKEQVKPDSITFISVLSACSHAGLVDEGEKYFASMREQHGIAPIAEHYACMTDLLGRVGQLAKAEELIRNMECEPDAAVWMALLSGCRLHGDAERGKRAAERVMRLDPQKSGAYVVLSQIYAAAGMWKEAAEIKKEMLDSRTG